MIMACSTKNIIEAVLNVSSAGCNHERQSFAKLSYSAIDNVSTNLLPAGLQDWFLSGAQHLECDDDAPTTRLGSTKNEKNVQ